jgi:protein SCO1/2
MMERRRVLLTLGVVLGAGAIGWFMTPNPNALPKGGDFTLPSAAGPVSLEALRGRVVVLYFGYASCPDVCPATLSFLGTALAALPADELAKVQGIFISLDPERDSPASLAPYAAHFHPRMVGVTGTATEVAALAAHYGVTFRKHGVDSALGYVVDHTSQLAIVAPDGRLVEVLEHGTPPEAISAAILRWTPGATAGEPLPGAPAQAAGPPAAAAGGEAAGITVVDPYVRGMAPGSKVTAAYLVLQNTHPSARALVRADVPGVQSVELHAVLTENGLTSMRPVAQIDLPAGGEARLEPSGNHIMLVGVDRPFSTGETVPLTLTFADGTSLKVDAPVR